MPEHVLRTDLEDGDYTGTITGGLMPDGSLAFEDGTATVASRSLAEQLDSRYVHVTHTGETTPVDDSTDGETTPVDDGDVFDADGFIDRTPMSDVVEDIESGDYDQYLDAIEAAATRQGVQDAIDARRES